MTEHVPQRRSGALRIAAFVWLALLSVFAAINYVTLIHFPDEAQQERRHASVVAAHDQLGEMKRVLRAQSEQQLALATTLEALQTVVDHKFEEVERALSNAASAASGSLLDERLSAVERQVARTTRAQRAAPSVPAESRQNPPAPPPFQIIGAELRGGERFLSVAPAYAESLSQVRVLRPGDSVQDWRLDAIEDNSALFFVDGTARRITFP